MPLTCLPEPNSPQPIIVNNIVPPGTTSRNNELPRAGGPSRRLLQRRLAPGEGIKYISTIARNHNSAPMRSQNPEAISRTELHNIQVPDGRSTGALKAGHTEARRRHRSRPSHHEASVAEQQKSHAKGVVCHSTVRWWSWTSQASTRRR